MDPTPEIIDLCVQKRVHANKVDRQSKDEYKRLKRLVEKKIRQALRHYVNDKCRECEEAFQKGNSHFMYKKVRELSKKKSSAAPTLLDIHGLPITDSEGRRERRKDHFSEKLKRKSGIVAPQFSGFFKRALELLISFQMTPLIDLSGLLTLEHATYNCPWENNPYSDLYLIILMIALELC